MNLKDSPGREWSTRYCLWVGARTLSWVAGADCTCRKLKIRFAKTQDPTKVNVSFCRAKREEPTATVDFEDRPIGLFKILGEKTGPTAVLVDLGHADTMPSLRSLGVSWLTSNV